MKQATTPSMNLTAQLRRCALLIAIVSATAAFNPRLLFGQEKEPIDVIRVNTDLVVFDVQVIDKKTKRTIGDLTKEDFELTDKGVRQQISYFSRGELPLSIMLMLDVSGSVRPIIHQIRDGALNALTRLKPEDQVAVMAFGTTYQLVQDFTNDRALVAKQVEAATATERLGSGTFLGPALEGAAIHMRNAPNPSSRRVVVIITDNVAFMFGSSEQDIQRELSDAGAVVYGLIVRAALGKIFNVLYLGQMKGVNKFVEQTGGEIVNADKKEIEAKLGFVIDRLRARYALGFRASNTIDDKKFRPVEIKISNAKKRTEKLLVLTKRGYYFRGRN